LIGRAVSIDNTSYTIVGVLPNQPAAWFGNNPVAEVWTTKPFILPGFSQERIMRGTGFLRVIGRPKSGMTIEQVRAALPSLDQSYATQYPDKADSSGFTTVKNLPEDVSGNLRPAFATLLAAVAFGVIVLNRGEPQLYRGVILERVEVRAEPYLDSKSVGRLSEKEAVYIVCHARGDEVQGIGAGGGPPINTRIWDKVRTEADGKDLGFVPDAKVDTGGTEPQGPPC